MKTIWKILIFGGSLGIGYIIYKKFFKTKKLDASIFKDAQETLSGIGQQIQQGLSSTGALGFLGKVDDWMGIYNAPTTPVSAISNGILGSSEPIKIIGNISPLSHIGSIIGTTKSTSSTISKSSKDIQKSVNSFVSSVKKQSKKKLKLW